MSIIKGSFIVVVGALGIKAASLVKDIIVSQKFGISPELGLYLSAFLIPSIISNQLGVCYQVMITPLAAKNNNKLDFAKFKNTFLQQALLVSAIYLILYFCINWIFPQSNLESYSLLKIILFLTLPYLLLMPIRTMFGQILYINNYHSSNMALGLITPAVVILYLFLKPEPTALDLGFSIAISSIIEFLVTFLFLKKINLITHESNFQYKSEILEILSGLGLQVLISSNLLIDQIYANRAGEEFLSVFNYASKIPGIIGSVSMILTSSIFLPFFQNMKSNNKKINFNKKKSFIGLTGTITITLVAYFFSYYITKIIYQRGNFDEVATLKVSQVQGNYFLMAPLTAIFLAFIRYLNAMNLNKLAMQYGIISFLSIWISNILFIHFESPTFIPFSVVSGYCIIFLIQLMIKRNKNESPSSNA